MAEEEEKPTSCGPGSWMATKERPWEERKYRPFLVLGQASSSSSSSGSTGVSISSLQVGFHYLSSQPCLPFCDNQVKKAL